MKKSRKKILLSSIAMLLVALVALGSATFAWFSVSKTVTADQISVKAVATAGLEISNTGADGTYATSVHFSDATPVDLKPVSWDIVSDHPGYIPGGNVAPDGGAYTGTDYKSVGSRPTVADTGVRKGSNTYFAVYDVWVRSAAEGSTRVGHNVDVNVKAAAGDKDGTGFVRAYLIDKSTASNSKVFAAGAATTTAIAGTDSSASGGTASVSAVDFNSTENHVTATDATTNGKAYELVVWYEGTDADCVDGGKNAVANLTLEFTATDM